MENPKEFKAQVFRDENGKVIRINIQCSSETTIHPDGRKDVTVFAPSLSLINKAINPAS